VSHLVTSTIKNLKIIYTYIKLRKFDLYFFEQDKIEYINKKTFSLVQDVPEKNTKVHKNSNSGKKTTEGNQCSNKQKGKATDYDNLKQKFAYFSFSHKK